jgi:uncharacterized iron-regulated membrane protein
VTTRAWPNRRTVWRWHFYAGVLCIPLVLWLAATGSIYLFKPQIDAWLDRPYDNLAISAPAAQPSAQVAAALATQPGSVLNAYELPGGTRAAVRVLIARGEHLRRVYVQPVTLQILHSVDEDSRLTNQIFRLHGELMQGDRGSMLVETAASWTIVMLITGLYLWWPTGANGAAGVVYPRLGRRGRLFWRDLHAVTGFWVTFFALFLLISGLPWAKSWGGMLGKVRHAKQAAPGRPHLGWCAHRRGLSARVLATAAVGSRDRNRRRRPRRPALRAIEPGAWIIHRSQSLAGLRQRDCHVVAPAITRDARCPSVCGTPTPGDRSVSRCRTVGSAPAAVGGNPADRLDARTGPAAALARGA